MTNEQLFLETIDDLRRKLERGDEYSLLRACGLLRHLLLDGNNLVDRVNKHTRCKIRFEIADYSHRILIMGNQFNWVSVKPSELSIVAEVSKDDFLKTDLLSYLNHVFNVLDVIKYTANILGGIHIDEAKDEKGKAFVIFHEAIQLHPDLTKKAVKAICDVTLKGLSPIETKLRLPNK